MASKLIGAIVGTFKVGTGVKVGPPTFQPDKPRMTLRGGAFLARAIASLTTVPVGAGMVTLKGKPLVVTSTYTLTIPHPALLTLKAKTFKYVEPDKQRPGNAQMTLKGKGFVLNKSATAQVGKPRMKLVGHPPSKYGKAGLIPTVAVIRTLVPDAAVDEGNLVPTPAYTELLVPTSVRVI